jgi:excisionase family DNA binding protein
MAHTHRWLTTQDAADRACCDPGEVRRAVRQGHLRADRTGGNRFRFLASWIDEWLANQLLPEVDEDDLVLDAAWVRRALSLR